MSLVTPDFGLLVWMTVIFAILFFILAKFGFPIITGMVNKRSDYIGKSLESAREAQRKVDALAEEQKRLIDETKREQSRILNEAAQTRDDIISEARQQARTEAEAILTQAREDIEAQRESALRDVRRQVADLSVEVAEKLVRNSLSDPEKADDYIFGYTAGNDLSARDCQFLSAQWLAGKAMPGFAPAGPYIATKDAFDPEEDNRIVTRVNGEICTQRGKKLYPGDRFRFDNTDYLIAAKE